MPVWIVELWNDFWHRTALYPYELAALLLAAIFFHFLPFRRALPAWDRLAARRRLSVALVFLFTICGHFALDPSYTAPAPGLHDEYSYLLAADTFAHGRLTNPPHPMGLFFESFHILTQPTYTSMYPPAQGFALAIGIWLAGHPMAGVWLSVAAGCAALCWMLQGWMRPRYALLGGLIAAVRIGWFSYWGNSYWGGAMAMIGGAMVLGALPRWRRRPSPSSALCFSTGALILLNSRPFEGVLLLLPAALWLLYHTRRNPKPYYQSLAIAAGVLSVGAAWMLYYNYVVTASLLTTPYSLNRNHYAIYKWFIGAAPDFSRTYNHAALEDFYKNSEKGFWQLPFLALQWTRALNLWWFFLGPALTLPLFGLWRYRRAASLRFAAILCISLIAGNFIVVWTILPHYAAPFTAAFYLLLTAGLRGLWRVRPTLANAVLATCLSMALLRAAAPSLGLKVYAEEAISWYTYGHLANTARAKMETRLAELGGKHLILVDYAPDHSPHMEWVYNRASIDDAPVVWSRTTPDPIRMSQLLQYFRDRRVWIVRPDQSATQLTEYRR